MIALCQCQIQNLMSLPNFKSKFLFATVYTLILCIIGVQCKHHKRIIGGRPAKIQESAHLVSLCREGDDHFCGGSLIHIKHVLTAAHCFYEDEQYEDPAHLYFIAGQSDLTKKYNPTQKLHVLAYVIHPKYNSLKKEHDLAMVRVIKPAALGPTIRLIRTAAQRPEPGTDCFVSGWGVTKSHSERGSNILLKVDIKIVPFVHCEKMELGVTHEEDQICAGDLAGGKDSCRGDSGGGLVCENYLAGVVSFGFDCGKAGYAGVYADVSRYADWIQSIINWDGVSFEPKMRKIDAKTLAKHMNDGDCKVSGRLPIIFLIFCFVNCI